ncbi:MAG: PAS domain S-box protein [Thermoplasmatota archaeon]
MRSLMIPDFKVLFIDDEQALLGQAKPFIEKINQKIDVSTVSSAEKALEILGEEDFHVIVSDYNMPDMDGLEFLKEIREEREDDIPFIFFTDKGREEVAIKALNLGADRYIQKGDDPKSQYEALAEAIVQSYEHWESKKRLKESEEELEEVKERYNALFERSLDAVYIHDLEGNILDANQATFELLGYEKSDIEDLKFTDILPDDQIEKAFEALEEIMETGTQKELTTFEVKAKSGERVLLETKSSLIYQDGEPYAILGIGRDITEKKEIEQKLRKDRKRFQEIFNNTNDAIYLHELTKEGMPGNFIEVNDTAVEMLGYSRDEFLEMSPEKIDAAEKADEVPDVMKELADEGEVRFEMVHQAKDGTKIPVEIYSHIFELEGEKRVLSVSRDITERMEAERKLKRSERRFRRIFEASPDSTFLLSKEGVFRDVNEVALKVVGYDKEEIVGKELQELPFLEEEAVKKTAENFMKRMKGEEVLPYEIEMISKDGDTIYAEINAKTFVEEEFEGEVVIARDITERKKMEEKLRESEQRFRTIIEGSADAIFLTDPEGNYTYTNEAASDLLGYSREELTQMNILELTKEENAEEYMKTFEKILEEEKTYTEISLVKKDGTEVHVDLNAVLLPNGKVYGSCRDITERREAEEREEILQSLLRHDITNKAMAVQGFLQLLEEGELSVDSKELVEEALKTNKESANIIQKVRLLLSAQKEEKEPVDIVSTIKDVVESNEAMAEIEGIDLLLDCPLTECKVEGGSLLREIFHNIIENSIHHSKGSRIKIIGVVKDDEVVCSIEDDGKGIPDDKKDIIFEKGYTTDEERGTGLGLFLVKNLLESYGGSIEVGDSDMGGARFDVKLKKVSQG